VYLADQALPRAGSTRHTHDELRACISIDRFSLLIDVNVLVWSETRGPDVTVPRAPDASGETTVWGQAASHFRRWHAGGDESVGALDDLVRCLTPVLWHVVRSYGLDKDQTEDVVQTAWLTLVRRHESIADPQAVASWLTTTARREAWRVSRTDGRATPVADEVIETRVPHQQAAESEVVRLDEKDRLWACVNKLDARCQRLLRIVAFDDRPDYQGIARDLDMPVGSIGPTRGRCLGKLRALLGQNSGADDE
jgi:RNA polymerase sigma factor (sigma-70 family)